MLIKGAELYRTTAKLLVLISPSIPAKCIPEIEYNLGLNIVR